MYSADSWERLRSRMCFSIESAISRDVPLEHDAGALGEDLVGGCQFTVRIRTAVCRHRAGPLRVDTGRRVCRVVTSVHGMANSCALRVH